MMMVLMMTKRGGESKDMTPAVIWELLLICRSRLLPPHYRPHKKAVQVRRGSTPMERGQPGVGSVPSRSQEADGGATFSTGMGLAAHGSRQGSRERGGVQERRGGEKGGGVGWSGVGSQGTWVPLVDVHGHAARASMNDTSLYRPSAPSPASCRARLQQQVVQTGASSHGIAAHEKTEAGGRQGVDPGAVESRSRNIRVPWADNASAGGCPPGRTTPASIRDRIARCCVESSARGMTEPPPGR